MHVVLAGTREMGERLGTARMESLAQRIGARFYLEPLDHDETMAYLRTQMKVAGLQWDVVFERGSDDAVFAATDGVPRLVNQLCDLALVQAGESGRKRVGPTEIAAAWRDIQRLPVPSFGHAIDRTPPMTDARPTAEGMPGDGDHGRAVPGLHGAIVEFGSFDADLSEEQGEPASVGGGGLDAGMAFDDGFDDAAEDEDGAIPAPTRAPAGRDRAPAATGNPWSGPEVELVFDGVDDPFAEYFADAERVVERYVVRGPDDFSDRRHVASREGASLSRQLPAADHPPASAEAPPSPAAVGPATAVTSDTLATDADDDTDMVVIEEDLWIPPAEADRRAVPVRPGDYRRLFARMRRGGAAE